MSENATVTHFWFCNHNAELLRSMWQEQEGQVGMGLAELCSTLSYSLCQAEKTNMEVAQVYASKIVVIVIGGKEKRIPFMDHRCCPWKRSL